MTAPMINERLARLAPTSAPDAERLSAAHRAVTSQLSDAGSAAGEPVRARKRVPMLRPVLAAAAITGLATTILIWPNSPGQPSAYATWAAAPAPVTPGDASHQKEVCAESIRSTQQSAKREKSAELEQSAELVSPDDLEPVVAERRGDWLYTLLVAGERGEGEDVVYECLMPSDGQSIDWGGWAGNAAAAPRHDEAAWQGATGGSDWRSVWGYVGEGVRAVTITRWDGIELEATVSDGYFAAWWPRPGREGVDSAPFTITWYLEDGELGGVQEWSSP